MVFDGDRLTIVPGVGSPMEARLVVRAGFDAIYISGYAASGMMHGRPDIGLIGLESVTELLRRVALVTDIPIVVDADTGYGDVSSILHTVRTLEAAGASAIQLEDQKWPKRCGHLEGKSLEDRDVAARKIAAAVSATQHDRTKIIARTDALAPAGLDEALLRVSAFEAAGADLTFVDAPPDLDTMRTIGSHGERPRVANMSESGKTPILPSDELRALGFSLALYPTSLVRAFSHVGRHILNTLAHEETTLGVADQIDSLADFNALVGMDEFLDYDAEISAANPTVHEPAKG